MKTSRRRFIREGALWIPAIGLACRRGLAQTRIPGPGGAATNSGGGSSGSSPALVAGTVKMAQNSPGVVTATTAAADTTGATLLVVMLGDYSSNTSLATVTDSYGNTWHFLTDYFDGVGHGGLWYAWDHGGSPLSAGSGHTVSVVANYPSFAFAAFNNTKATSNPYDGTTVGAGANAGSVTVPSLTPTQSNELVITGIGATDVTGAAVNSGFTILGTIENSSAGISGASLAFLVQTTATAETPQWSGLSGPPHIGATMAAFKGQ
jgi:hypothetical protein